MKPIIEATPTQMRLHATPKHLVPRAPDHEPSACALDSSRSLPFIAPLRSRWSPVVFQRKMPSIPFPFLLLRDSFFLNDRGTPTPLIEFRSPLGTLCIFSVQPLASSLQSLSSLLATDPEIAPVSSFLATHPKTQVLKVLCSPHIQEMAGVGGILLAQPVAQTLACVGVASRKMGLRTCTEGQSDRLGEYRTPKESIGGRKKWPTGGRANPALERGHHE